MDEWNVVLDTCKCPADLICYVALLLSLSSELADIGFSDPVSHATCPFSIPLSALKLHSPEPACDAVIMQHSAMLYTHEKVPIESGELSE